MTLELLIAICAVTSLAVGIALVVLAPVLITWPEDSGDPPNEVAP